MSLINCPECGKEISDKSEKCIYCGYPLENKVIKKPSSRCILCGTPIEYGQEICSQCMVDYDIPKEKEHYSMIRKRENDDGIVAIVLAIIIPIVGFIMGIIFIIRNDDKSKPFLAIILSIVSFYANWYFMYHYLF